MSWRCGVARIHLDFPNWEVDANRGGAAPNCRVLWIVSPEVPLNPTHGPAFLLNHEYVGGLSAVNARAVFRLYTRRIRALIPPNSHVRGGEPFLKQREIGSFKRSK